MNEVVNKISLAGDQFMPEMYLRQPGFTHSTCGPFTKNKEKLQKFKELLNLKQTIDKACFQHDIACGDFKDLPEKQLLIKYYIIKHLILLKIRNMMDMKEVLLQWFINLWIRSLQVVLLHKFSQRPQLSAMLDTQDKFVIENKIMGICN